jgi:hypothetical protein
MSRIKKYKLTVGIDYPHIGEDDTFDIDLPIDDDEIQSIIDGALRLYWVRDSAETWEYIECFAPKAYKKGIALAEAYCIPKWGEKMKVENGARYEIFLPDEIDNALINDPRWINENQIRARQREASRKQFHEDHRIFHNANNIGRFKNKLKKDPIWNNSVFSGIWSSSSEDYAGLYGLHTIIMNNVELGYERIYKRDEVEFRVEIRHPIETYLDGFFAKHNDYYKKEDFVLHFDYNPHVIITTSKGDKCDIEFFMNFVEYLVTIKPIEK